jgi:predicted ATP-dependent protease
VNQRGEIQAIGGVNEKIEGFYRTCRRIGLTGTQGVMIPAANVRHLALHPEVIDAVREGRFAVYPVRTVEEGLSLLTGLPAGTPKEPGTVLGIVDAALLDMAQAQGIGRKSAGQRQVDFERRGDAAGDAAVPPPPRPD